MKLLTTTLETKLTFLAFAAAFVLVLGYFTSRPSKADWRGLRGDTRTVTAAELRDAPHTTLTGVAQDLTRIVGSIPRNPDGYIFQWIPGDANESGHFRVSAWSEAPTKGPEL